MLGQLLFAKIGEPFLRTHSFDVWGTNAWRRAYAIILPPASCVTWKSILGQNPYTGHCFFCPIFFILATPDIVQAARPMVYVGTRDRVICIARICKPSASCVPGMPPCGYAVREQFLATVHEIHTCNLPELRETHLSRTLKAKRSVKGGGKQNLNNPKNMSQINVGGNEVSSMTVQSGK